METSVQIPVKDLPFELAFNENLKYQIGKFKEHIVKSKTGESLLKKFGEYSHKNIVKKEIDEVLTDESKKDDVNEIWLKVMEFVRKTLDTELLKFKYRSDKDVMSYCWKSSGAKSEHAEYLEIVAKKSEITKRYSDVETLDLIDQKTFEINYGLREKAEHLFLRLSKPKIDGNLDDFISYYPRTFNKMNFLPSGFESPYSTRYSQLFGGYDYPHLDYRLKLFINRIMGTKKTVLAKEDKEKKCFLMAWKMIPSYSNCYLEAEVTREYLMVKKIGLLYAKSLPLYKNATTIPELAFLKYGVGQVMTSQDLIEERKLYFLFSSIRFSKLINNEKDQNKRMDSYENEGETIKIFSINFNNFKTGIFHTLLHFFDHSEFSKVFGSQNFSKDDKTHLSSIRNSLKGKRRLTEKCRIWVSKKKKDLNQWQIDLMHSYVKFIKLNNWTAESNMDGNLQLSKKKENTTKRILLEISEGIENEENGENDNFLSQDFISYAEEHKSWLKQDWNENTVFPEFTNGKASNLSLSTTQKYWYVPKESDLVEGYEYVAKNYPIVLSCEKPSEKAIRIYWNNPKRKDKISDVDYAFWEQRSEQEVFQSDYDDY